MSLNLALSVAQPKDLDDFSSDFEIGPEDSHVLLVEADDARVVPDFGLSPDEGSISLSPDAEVGRS